MIVQIKILKGCYIEYKNYVTEDNVKILAIYYADGTTNYLDMINRRNLKDIKIMSCKREIELYTDSELFSQWI